MKKGKLLLGVGIGLVAVAGAVFGVKKYEEKTGKSLLNTLKEEAETPSEALTIEEQMMMEELDKEDEEETEDNKIVAFVKANKKVVGVSVGIGLVAVVGAVKFLGNKKKKQEDDEVDEIEENINEENSKYIKSETENHNDDTEGGDAVYNPNANIVNMEFEDDTSDYLYGAK